MKLTELSVDDYGVCNNLRLPNLGSGLNVVFGGASAGKTTLTHYIRNVLYGFKPQSSMGHGSLEAIVNGSACRLSRTLDSRNQLVVSDTRGTGTDGIAATELRISLDEIGGDVFESAFMVDSRNVSRSIESLVRILHHRCSVPPGRAAFGNEREFTEATRNISERQKSVDSLVTQMAALERQRSELSQKIDSHEIGHRSQLSEMENEIRLITEQIDRLNQGSLQSQIQSLDREIADLRLRIESAAEHVQYVSRPGTQSDGLAILYARLDEIDDQIRRWRHIHSDIQQQRVQLKDEMIVWNEMTIDSTGHPYHRAREILTSIESKVGLAERSVGDLQNVQIVSPEDTAQTADRLGEICSQIRGDLYELCDELGSQYKEIRHRSAATELKRLRRCYEEITENIDIMIANRQRVIEEIRLIDPEGALAVNRQDADFCNCVQHDGYLQARRRYVGEIQSSVSQMEVVRQDTSFDSARLAELENLRAVRVKELVDNENRLSELEARRQSLVTQCQRLPAEVDLAEVQSRIDQIQLDLRSLEDERQIHLTEIQRDRSIQMQPANPILVLASELARKLTRGEIVKVWLSSGLDFSSDNRGIEIEDRAGSQRAFSSLQPTLQRQIQLGLSLAVAEYFRRAGRQLPLIIDDAFSYSNPEFVRLTFDVLTESAAWGNQIIALSADRSVREMCNVAGIAWLEMPETAVSPVTPSWTPDRNTSLPPREPEFLTPFTTRPHLQMHADMKSYPQVKYPPTGHVIDYSAANFETTSASVSRSFDSSPLMDESMELSQLGLVDSIDLERLSRVGVSRVEQLLAIDPGELPEDFVNAPISSGQVDKWQSQAWMILCVPGLTPVDAQILYSIGITEPEMLDASGGQQLVDRINRFLTSTDGQQFASLDRDYNRQLADRWYDSLNRTSSNWRKPSGYSRHSRWARSPGSRHTRPSNYDRNRPQRRDWRPTREFDRSQREPRERQSSLSSDSQFTVSSVRDKEPSDRNRAPAEMMKLKFYLDLSDDLEAAPSIGPKTSERFAKVKVRTIAEFLTQTAESMATRINYKRITADVIRQWQHQARMVCRVPNMRGHDAQLLVACGIVEPEDLAGRDPKRLYEIIAPFSESKEGLKIIRGSKQPDLEEITDWIKWARQTRSLQAA